MKANELMIGDLLKWKEQPGFNDEDRNMVLRVKNIFDDAIKIDGRFELYHISLFEPIPLTTEILEKNGFEKQQFGNFIYENDDVNLRIEFYPKNINYTNGCYDYIDIEKGCVTITEMPIEFVHELQHALRLCEIDKTIEL